MRNSVPEGGGGASEVGNVEDSRGLRSGGGVIPLRTCVDWCRRVRRGRSRARRSAGSGRCTRSMTGFDTFCRRHDSSGTRRSSTSGRPRTHPRNWRPRPSRGGHHPGAEESGCRAVRSDPVDHARQRHRPMRRAGFNGRWKALSAAKRRGRWRRCLHPRER